MRIGTLLHQALERVGITPERVEAVLGVPCGCRERVRQLDAFGGWARTVLMGRPREQAVRDLDGLLEHWGQPAEDRRKQDQPKTEEGKVPWWTRPATGS